MDGVVYREKVLEGIKREEKEVINEVISFSVAICKSKIVNSSIINHTFWKRIPPASNRSAQIMLYHKILVSFKSHTSTHFGTFLLKNYEGH